MIKCANCGTENEPDSVFCSACNHFLQWDEPVRKPRRRSRVSADLAAAIGAESDSGPQAADPAAEQGSGPQAAEPGAVPEAPELEAPEPAAEWVPGPEASEPVAEVLETHPDESETGSAASAASAAPADGWPSADPATVDPAPTPDVEPVTSHVAEPLPAHAAEGDSARAEPPWRTSVELGTPDVDSPTEVGSPAPPPPTPSAQPASVPQAKPVPTPRAQSASVPEARPVPTPQVRPVAQAPVLASRSVPTARSAAPTARREPAVRPNDPGAKVSEIVAAIDAGREIAAGQGRIDLEQHLAQTKERLAGEPIQVVFCGQFKVGKSTMINALLQRAVCPVDADVVTAVPTVVKYSPQPKVTTYVRSEDGDRISEQERPLGEIDLLVTEEADPSDPERDRVVEVGLPHRMLRTGLALVDTPGVGGLDSAHGYLTLSALRQAKGVVFVSDAAQELTAPELTFLKTAVERCPNTAVVVTKTDLYPYWRKIADLDRRHLATAGLDLPLLTVSSFLRLRAAKDPALNAESGFSELVAFLARDVVAKTRTELAKAAAAEVDFVASQLEQQSQAERAVIESPQSTERVVKELDRVQEQAKRLIHPTATWQQTLSDGIQDLASDVEHDLQARLRNVIHDVEEVIDAGDPQETWSDTEVWLRRKIAIVTMDNRDMLTERAEDLAQEVADHFELPAGSKLVLPLGGVDFDSVTLAPASSLAMPGGKLAPLLVAARSSYYLPMMLGSVVAGVLGGGVVIHLAMAGVSLVLGTGIGKKIIGDEKKRQRTYRQQQAKGAARRFIDEVAFTLNKETRDVLRTAQRHLRDDFQSRAMQLERSAHEAMGAAQRLSQLDETQRAARAEELQTRESRLASVRAAAREVSAAPGPAVPGKVASRG